MYIYFEYFYYSIFLSNIYILDENNWKEYWKKLYTVQTVNILLYFLANNFYKFNLIITSI